MNVIEDGRNVELKLTQCRLVDHNPVFKPIL